MVEAAKLNHIDTPVDEEFQIVGAGYKIHTPEFRKPMVRDKLRGKPIASIIILSFIAFGCICAGLFANHDPNGFYLLTLIVHLVESSFSEQTLWAEIYIQ